MAQRIYNATREIQDNRLAAVTNSFEKVLKLEYAGAMEEMVGTRLWGAHQFEKSLYNKVFYRTGLQGQAQLAPDNVRQTFPSPTYQTGELFIRDFRQLGISYEYYPEDMEDIKPQFNFVADLISDLPMLLADAEEDEHHFVYNNGTSLTGGLFDTPLFVDGTTQRLQLLGQPNYFAAGSGASNIITGGISYALIALLRQYGENFINDEGRLQPRRVVQILCSPQNGDLLEMYFGATYNIETGNPATANPNKAGTPTIVRTNRLANKNDMIVFYDGWSDHLVERNMYRGKAESWEEGQAQFRKLVSQLRSRYGYYWISNRLVVLVRGAA